MHGIHEGEKAGEKAKSGGFGILDSVKGAVSGVGEKIGHVAESATEVVGGAVEGVKDTTASAYDKV
ncbi:hypothetical protein COOONC_27977 [Cooperia oncophora]